MAVRFGFKAIEFDVWFLTKSAKKNFNKQNNFTKNLLEDGELVISHDFPQNLSIDSIPRFADFLSHGNAFEYWIDLKNANTENCQIFAKKIFDELLKKNIDFHQVLIAPYITNYEIAQCVFNNFKEIFGKNLNFVAVCDSLRELDLAVEFIKKNQLKFLSIDHRIIDAKSFQKIRGIKLLVWTVNSKERLEELSKIGIKDPNRNQHFQNHEVLNSQNSYNQKHEKNLDLQSFFYGFATDEILP